MFLFYLYNIQYSCYNIWNLKSNYCTKVQHKVIITKHNNSDDNNINNNNMQHLHIALKINSKALNYTLINAGPNSGQIL